MRTDERIALLDQMRRVKEQGEKEVQAPEEKTLTLEDALAALSEGKLELEDGRLLEFEICPYFKEEFPFICFKGFYQASQEDESGRILVNHTEGVSQIINWTPQKRAAKTLEQWSNLLVNGMAANRLSAQILKKKSLETVEYFCFEDRIREFDGVTYKDLFLSSIDVVYIRRLDIVQKPGSHASLYLEAVLDGEQEENELQNISKTMTLMYRTEGETRPLFYGVIDKIFIRKDGEDVSLYLEAWDATYLMDTERRIRIFQNPQMTPEELMAEVMCTYPAADYKLNVPKMPIGQLIIQYEETDWEFLNRFFARYKEPLYPNPESECIRVLAGESPDTEQLEWDSLPYTLLQDYGELNRRKENGLGELLEQENVQYQIETYEIASLGNEIRYKGSFWYIGGVERHLEKGILVNSYVLRKEAGLKVLPYFNQRLTGISIDGQIAAAKRDRVQVDMEIDNGGKEGEHYWFPYSTVASSPDGSGWYCMPENGESVRVYFPVADEKEAYVVTNIKAHEPKEGNQVQFTEEGVVIAAGRKQGSILLKKSGEVLLDAVKDISISAGKAVNIVAANEVIMKSETSIRIASEQGADVELKKGKVTIHGMTIHEN